MSHRVLASSCRFSPAAAAPTAPAGCRDSDVEGMSDGYDDPTAYGEIYGMDDPSMVRSRTCMGRQAPLCAPGWRSVPMPPWLWPTPHVVSHFPLRLPPPPHPKK